LRCVAALVRWPESLEDSTVYALFLRRTEVKASSEQINSQKSVPLMLWASVPAMLRESVPEMLRESVPEMLRESVPLML
jgi:hypothetical protein